MTYWRTPDMLIHMRTTLRLDPDLLREAKVTAAESGQTLTALFTDALREALARRREATVTRPPDFPVFHGTGLLPGVDITDSAALLDLMDATP